MRICNISSPILMKIRCDGKSFEVFKTGTGIQWQQLNLIRSESNKDSNGLIKSSRSDWICWIVYFILWVTAENATMEKKCCGEKRARQCLSLYTAVYFRWLSWQSKDQVHRSIERDHHFKVYRVAVPDTFVTHSVIQLLYLCNCCADNGLQFR